MKKYRVLRIMHRMSISGPTFHSSYLTKYLNDDFETKLLSGVIEETEKDGSYIMEQVGIEPTYINNMARSIDPLKDYASYKEILAIVREFKPHIIHTHAAKSGALGRLAAAKENTPVVLHTFHGHIFHSYFGYLKTKLFLNIERYLAKKSTRIIAISNRQKQELTQKFKICKPDRMEVIPLGFDLTRFTEDNQAKRQKFRQEFRVADDEIAIGIIGRVTAIKNHPHFIESFAGLKNETSKRVKAFIVGDGEELENCMELARSLGMKCVYRDEPIPDDVDIVFTSWREDIDTIVNGLDIVALTSLNEGTPVTLIEAQACGTAVVSTRVGGIEDIVIENESALLSPVGDIPAFTKNLKTVVEDNALRSKMAQSGSFVLEQFSYRRLVSDIEKLYYQLLKEKGL